MPLPAGKGLKNMWHQVFEVPTPLSLPLSLSLSLSRLLSQPCLIYKKQRSKHLNPKRTVVSVYQNKVNLCKPHTMQTGQKFSKQHPSWLWNILLCKPCFSWKRCKHRKPCPVIRSTHAGASAGGGDGVPFTEPKKTFAGQQGLHSPGVTAERLGSRWNLPSFAAPCLYCSKAWKWVHPTGLGWNVNRAAKMSVAGCHSNERHCLRDPMTLDIKYVWGLLPNCSAQGLFSLSDGIHQDLTGKSFHYRQPWLVPDAVGQE